MRGNPLWQLLAVAVAFVLMGLPVWRLTRPAQAAPLAEPTVGGKTAPKSLEPMNTVTMVAEADFAPAPTEFTLSYLGKLILQSKGQTTAKAEAKTPVPADGADLVLHAVWPPTTDASGDMPVAAKVVIRFSDGRQVEKSFWSTGGAPLDTVLSVPGNGGTAAP